MRDVKPTGTRTERLLRLIGPRGGVWSGKDKSFYTFVSRAYGAVLIIVVSSIGLYANVETGEVAPYAPIVIGNVFLLQILIMWYYSTKIFALKPRPHDPRFITAVSVGAVSAITAFLGTASALSATLLLSLWPPDKPIDSFLVMFGALAGWLFVVLTLRFHEACYFYQVWDLRREHGLEADSLLTGATPAGESIEKPANGGGSPPGAKGKSPNR